MATQKQDTDSQNRWKTRYYEALEELEHKEQHWREAERLLRHLVTRLTLAADTRHKGLNQNLKDLRNAIRDGRDVSKLNTMIDTVSEQVAELDTLRKARHNQQHPAQILVEVLDKLTLPAELTRQLRQLKKQVNKLSEADSVESVVEQAAAMLNQLQTPDSGEPAEKSRKQKLLDRILSRQVKPEPDADTTPTPSLETQADSAEAGPIPPATTTIPQKFLAPAVGDLLLQMALRMPVAVRQRINFATLKKHINRARTRKDLIPIIDVLTQHIEAAYKEDAGTAIVLDENSVLAMAQAVQQFFAQLEPPLDMRERVAEIEQYYSERNQDIGSLVHCLNALAEVVAEICKRLAFQRDELETFFVQLSDRLQELDSGLKKTGEFYTETGENNASMDRAVHAEMQGIQSSMQTSDDLAQLKLSIAARLDAIDQHLQRFRDQEQQRLVTAQQTISELSSKVVALEADSARLHTRLEETRQQALRDVLTGVPNREAYEDRLATEIARCKRYATSLSMVVWDVDKFKTINDTYGHAAGDRVLKVVAKLLSEKVRETDFVARYGGEEFVMLMPETELIHAQQVADKLRIEIENTPFHFRDTRVAVTISAGIAQYRQDELVTQLFERADAALYQAKQAGRNQVRIAD